MRPMVSSARRGRSTRTTRIATIAVATVLATVARAQAPDAMADAYPLTLAVGEAIALCQTGTLLCPAAATRCDDTSVVDVGADDRGPVLTGVRPGSTLCSAATASGMGARRVYRVTVTPNPAR